MPWTFYDADGRTLVAQGGTADVATSVTASANNSTDETVYPTFVDGATGTQGIETDTGLTYNPSSGILTSTQFTGAVSGNATTATTATNVTANANNSTDETVYPTFVDGATGGQEIETDTGLTYNPSTGVLTSTQFTGNVSGNLTGTLQTAAQTNITSVGTIGTGVWQGTVVAAAYLPDAGTGAQGVVELATSAETTTGTSAALAVTPDSLSQSVVFGTRYIQCVVFDAGAFLAEGDGKFFFHIPAGLNGMNLVETHARVATAGSGSAVQVQLFLNTSTTNAATGNDMLTNLLTIDDGELDSSNSGVSEDIDETYDDVDTNDMIRIDVDGDGGGTTIAKGLIVTLGFRIPD